MTQFNINLIGILALMTPYLSYNTLPISIGTSIIAVTLLLNLFCNYQPYLRSH